MPHKTAQRSQTYRNKIKKYPILYQEHLQKDTGRKKEKGEVKSSLQSEKKETRDSNENVTNGIEDRL
jgi:hypothetical protein